MKPRISRWFRFLLLPPALGLAMGFLEISSRVVHRGKAPLLPYHFESGAAYLTPGSDITASFYGSPANRYITDDWSARVAGHGLPDDLLDRGVLVVGDSQALGYMLNFEETFASRVAGCVLGDPRAVRILAAPTNHPDSYDAVVRRFAPLRRGRPRLAVVTLNLGNDLDEMYGEGLDWSRESTSPVRRWLLSHSFLYMDLELIRAHRLQAGDELIGVNNILYMLEPDERVVLAREAAHKVGTLLAAIDAAEKLVVIVPADIQVDPKEFSKYRRYYGDPEQFEALERRSGELSSMMGVLENYIASRLERDGHRVVRLTTLVGGQTTGEPLFMSSNHHITAKGHALIARAICEGLPAPAGTPAARPPAEEAK